VPAQPESDYYLLRRKRLLSLFDRLGRRMNARLAERTGTAEAHAIVDDARCELESILPELPFIGGNRNVFTWVVVVNGYIIALERAMKRRGFEPREAVAVCVEVTDELLRKIPAGVLRLAGRLAFSSPSRRFFRAQAARSQERRYPDDFVYTVRESGDGEMSLVFEECAVNKLYDAMAVEELKPYCNFFDVTYSRLMGMGVDARETIGLGCETCELRYKHGRATPMPPTLEPAFRNVGVDRATADGAPGAPKNDGTRAGGEGA
jgi:hypothetical protein